MAKRKAIENFGNDTAAKPEGTSNEPRHGGDLPLVESPAISPATTQMAEENLAAAASADSIASAETLSAPGDNAFVGSAVRQFPRLKLRPRHRRYALLAASVTIAAAFGAAVGVAATGGFFRTPPVDISAAEENKTMRQSLARLDEEITGLKSTFEAASKSAHNQIAKLSERLESDTREITGSISPPQAVSSSPKASAPLLAPRAAQPPSTVAARHSIVQDWFIRETRGGYIYVQGHGDIYQVTPGVPLPGLGPVEQIKRRDGRWLVVTPKGIIVSLQDRRYFEQF